MKKIFCLVLILFLFVSIPVFAEKYTARQLIDHIYITGGQLPINDMVIVMEVNSLEEGDAGAPPMMKLTSKDKVFFKKPNSLRVDSMIAEQNSPLQGKLITIIRDGNMRFMYISMGEFPIKKEKDTPTPSSAIPFNLQVYPSDTAFKYIYLGSENMDGKKTEIVGVINPNADPRINLVKVWIDVQKWIPARVEKKQIVKSGNKEEVIDKAVVYKEPQKLKDGRWMPFVLEIYIKGELTQKFVYTQVGVNVGLEKSLFEPLKQILPEASPMPPQ